MTAAKRVLVVDDEELMRELVRSLLEAEGYTVELADSGESGLQKIQADPPDLVLLDLIMPGISGWEVLERLTEYPDPPAVVVMSGMQVAAPDEHRAFGHFVNGYLSKPFNSQELTRMCAEALAHRRPPSASMQPLAEHRGTARKDLLVPATLGSSAGTPLVVGRLLNMSATGAMFDLGAAFKEISLAFEIPGAEGFFHVTGQTTWMKDGKLGVRFTNVPREERMRLGEMFGPAST